MNTSNIECPECGAWLDSATEFGNCDYEVEIYPNGDREEESITNIRTTRYKCPECDEIFDQEFMKEHFTI